MAPILAILLLAAAGAPAVVGGAQLPGAARVARVEVRGNHAFSRKAITKLLRMAPRHRFPFGTTSPTFYADFLRADLRTIEGLYQNSGFLDVQVSAQHASVVRRGQEWVDIILTIVEGPEWRFSQVAVRGVTIVPPAQILRLLGARIGQPYNELLIPVDRETIKNFYAERGYIRVTVNPSIEYADTTASLTYEVTERWPVRFGPVAIRDTAEALRTEEPVIRRNFLFHTGETFSSSKLSDSEQRLYDTGLFNEVRFEFPPTDPADTSRVVDLTLYLTERKSRYVGGGVEYDAQSNLTLSTDGGFRNLSGMNRRLEASASAGVGVNRIFNNGRVFALSHVGLTFTEPWFLGTRQQAIVGVAQDFVRDQQKQRQRTYTTTLSFGLRRDLSRQTHVAGDIRNAWVRQLGFPSSDSTATSLPSRFQNRTLNLSLDSDRRNSFFNPTRGALYGLSAQYAGLGGQTRFLKGLGSASHYRPLAKTVVLAGRLRIGAIGALPGPVPAGVTDEQADLAKVDFVDRFRLGGAATIRAYGEDAIGKENVHDPYVDPLDTLQLLQFHPGGLGLLLVNLEIRWMLNSRFGLAAFTDGGNVWGVLGDVSHGRLLPAPGKELGADDMRWDVGAGIRFMTPIGPVRFDYARKLGAPPVSYSPAVREHSGTTEPSGRFTIALGQAF